MKPIKFKRYKGYALVILSDGTYFDYYLKKGKVAIKSLTVYSNKNQLMKEVDLDIKMINQPKTNIKLRNFIFNLMIYKV